MLRAEYSTNVSMRRLRREEHLRAFISEKRITMSDLCHPVFIRNDIDRATEVENMPGIFYYPLGGAIEEIKRVRDLGVKHFVIRPRPHKSAIVDVNDIIAFESWVLNAVSKDCPDVTKIVDGYFGMIRPNGYYGAVNDDGTVNVPATLRELQDHAVGQGNAGADIIVALGRVDHAVKAIREALDQHALHNVGILAYSVNFASSLAHAMLDGTDMARNAYRQTVASKVGVGNIDEALRQTAIDVAQGADYIGVKPATVFLDAIALIKMHFRMPVATYIVSKEYVMVKAAARNGWINERDTVLEYMLSMKRAGADKIFSYWAKDMAGWLRDAA